MVAIGGSMGEDRKITRMPNEGLLQAMAIVCSSTARARQPPRKISTHHRFGLINNQIGKMSSNMANVGNTIVVSVPHIGLSKDSARGFALDQFLARQQGYQSFAEWSVHCFDQALQISGEVRESDSIDIVTDEAEPAGSATKNFWIRGRSPSAEDR
ncbi:hypothetical protein ACOJBO_08055 [Rhizobium beringeri]